MHLSASIHYHFSQEPKFVTGEEKARKLFDLQNFAAYFDTEVLGELEGQELVVRFHVILSHSHTMNHNDLPPFFMLV